MASAAVEMLTLSHCRKMIVFNTNVTLDFDRDAEPVSAIHGTQRKRMLSETEEDPEKGPVKKRRKQSKPVRIASESLSDEETRTDNGRLLNIGDGNSLICDKLSTEADSDVNHDELKVKPCDRTRDGKDGVMAIDDCALLSLPINLTNNTKPFISSTPFSCYTNAIVTETDPGNQSLEKLRRVSDSTNVSFHEPSCETMSSFEKDSIFGAAHTSLSLTCSKPSAHSVHPVNNSCQSGSPVRIFNPEAFCDLCNKEFCNKYFLKTHKANKHGIYTENIGSSLIDPLSSLPYINYFSGIGEVLPSNNSEVPRSILRKPQLSVSLPQQNGVFLQKTPGNQTNGNCRAFCNICQREFCNKYFVRRHKAKIHGIIDTSFPDTPPGTSEGHDQKNFNSNDIKSCVENHEKSQDHEIYSTFSGLSIVATDDSDKHENRFPERKAGSSVNDHSNPLIQNRDIDSDECTSPPAMPKSTSPIQTMSVASVNRQDVIDRETDSSDKNIKRLGITNSEAFCDICCKEYCNKYFLKTHKMRSHGIAQTEWDKREDRPNNQIVPLNLIVGDQTLDKADNNSSDMEADVDIFCKVCGQKFRNAFLLEIHLSYVHPQPVASDSENKLKSKQLIKTNSGCSSTSAPIAIIDGEHKLSPAILVCDMCQKQFLDALSLETHIETQHSNFLDEATSLANDNADSHFSLKPIKHHCPSCQRRFPDTTLLEEHIVECSTPGEYAPIEFQLLKTTTAINDIDESSKHSHMQAAVHIANVSEVQVAPTSSFCEICKKELCNKYFMKTHMQRMHGISIDNGAHIGGVVCDICNKELCSKYFLRVHKQNSHGIVDEILGLDSSRIQSPGVDLLLRSSEQSDIGNRYFSHFTEVCAICSRRFRSIKWLKAHLMNDHGNDGKEKWKQLRAHYEFKQLNRYSQEAQKAEPTGVGTRDFKEGFSKKPDPASCRSDESGENRKYSVFSTIFNGKNTNAKQYHCSYCPFATSILAFLFVHERSHANSSDLSFSFETEEPYEKHCVSHSISESTDSTSSGSSPNRREKVNEAFISESINRTDPDESENLTGPDDSQTPPSACRFNANALSSNGVETKAASAPRTLKWDNAAGEEESISQPLFQEPNKEFALYENRRRDVESDDEINVALVQAKQLLELIADKTDVPVSFSLPQNQKSAIMQPFVLEDSGEIFLPDVNKAAFKKSFLSSIVFLPVTERLNNPVTVSFKLTPTL